MASHIGQAAKAGDIEKLRLLISNGASVRIPDDGGWYPLHQAAAGGHINCLRMLLNHEDIDIDWITSEGETAIYLAARGGHAECLQMLIDANGNVDIQTSCGVTALSEATKGSHKECVEYLIKGGANPNLKTKRCHRPVFIAAETPDLLEILTILLPVSQLEYVPGASRWSPLHSTILKNNIEAAKLILDYGVDVNTGYIHVNAFSQYRLTMTPLYLSYIAKNMELFRLFLSRGAVLRCERIVLEVNCYAEEVFLCFEDDVKHYINAMRDLVDYGLNLNCNCGIRYNFHRFIGSTVQLHFYKFLLDSGLIPQLECWNECLCNHQVCLKSMFVRSISLALSYVPCDRLCPGSLEYLKDSAYWPHINKFVERPAPLQHLCRLAVREILRPKGLHRMKQFVSNMEITNVTKSYLLYEDCLTDMILKEQPQPETE